MIWPKPYKIAKDVQMNTKFRPETLNIVLKLTKLYFNVIKLVKSMK